MGASSDGADTLTNGEAIPDWRILEPMQLSPILTAALDAFYETGFHGTSVREIARRVGVTVPALYYHHENKEGLLIALLELSTSDVLSELTPPPRTPTATRCAGCRTSSRRSCCA